MSHQFPPSANAQQRPSRRSLLAVAVWTGVAIACAGGAAGEPTVAPPGNGAPDAPAGRDCPTGGDPQPPIAFGRELKPSSTSTTELTICLNQNVDRLLLMSQVLRRGGPVTSCVIREVLRIGREPTPWQMGTVRAFELSYPEALPPGKYEELITAIVATSGYDYFQMERTARLFELDAAGLRPIVSDRYELEPESAAPLASTAPCPALQTFGDIPNDELPAGQTVSVVDVDEWNEVSTIQPLRHEVDDLEQPMLVSSALSFAAYASNGARIQLQLEYLPRAGEAFESEQFSLVLSNADGIQWYSRSGRIGVQPLGGEQLEVRLSGVVLEKGRTIDEPAVTRSLPDGTITAPVTRLCRTPFSEYVDSTWSSPYCAQIRQAAGF